MATERPIIHGEHEKSNSQLIILSGKRGSGKDTFAQFLIEACRTRNIKAVTLQSSKELKKRFCDQFGLDLSLFLTDREYKEHYREQLTTFVFSQSQEENFEHLELSIENALTDHTVVIISDVRTQYDLDNLKNSFPACITIRINSNDTIRISRVGASAEYDNSSLETELDNAAFDHVINNNGSLEEFKSRARELFEV